MSPQSRTRPTQSGDTWPERAIFRAMLKTLEGRRLPPDVARVEWDRRRFMAACLGGVTTLIASASARASMARAVSLKALTRSSQHIIVGTPVDAESRWEVLGGRERIVTYSRVVVSELVAGADPKQGELLLRSLGGRVGQVGQIVHGEAELAIRQPALLFIGQTEAPLLFVQAMSQGEYPLVEQKGVQYLKLSRRLLETDEHAQAATTRLRNQSLERARSLISEAAR